MSTYAKKSFRFEPTLKHWLALAYCLALVTLLFLLAVESSKEGEPASLSEGKISKRADGSYLLTLFGEGLHNKSRGLYFDSDQEEPPLLWKLLGGVSIRAIDANERIVLAACFQNKLVSIRKHSTARPVLSTSLEMPQPIRFVKIVGDRALVGMSGGGGLATIEISKDGALSIKDHYPIDGTILSMVAQGTYVYFLNYEEGLGVLDFTDDKPAPRMIEKIEKPWVLSAAENKVAVANIEGNISLFDIDPNGQVKKVGILTLQGVDRGGVRGIGFTSGTLNVALRGRVLKSFSIKDWPRFNRFFDMNLPGEPYNLVRVPGRESLLVSLVSGGLAKVDILLNGEGVLKGHMALPTTPLSLDVDGKLIYLSGNSSYAGLHAFNIDDIERKFFDSIQFVGHEYRSLISWNDRLFGYRRDKNLVDLNLPGQANHANYGRYLTMAENEGAGVYRLPESSPPIRLGSVLAKEKIFEVLQEGDSWFVLHSKGLKVFTGAHPEAMEAITDFEIAGSPNCMKSLHPGILLIATRYEGLKILDVADPYKPALIARLSFPAHLNSHAIAKQVVVDGSFAYVSKGSGGVYVVNLSNPAKPALSQVIDTPGRAKGMIVHKGILYVADSDMGVFLVDVADKENLLPVGTLPTSISVEDVALGENSLIVSSYPAGTVRVAIPQRIEHLELVDDGEMRGRISGSNLKGYAYLYDDFGSSRVRVTHN